MKLMAKWAQLRLLEPSAQVTDERDRQAVQVALYGVTVMALCVAAMFALSLWFSSVAPRLLYDAVVLVVAYVGLRSAWFRTGLRAVFVLAFLLHGLYLLPGTEGRHAGPTQAWVVSCVANQVVMAIASSAFFSGQETVFWQVTSVVYVVGAAVHFSDEAGHVLDAAVSVLVLHAVLGMSILLAAWHRERLHQQNADLMQTALLEAQTNEKLTMLAQAKTAFISSISHEIRTPLNGLIGLVDALMETPFQQESQRELAEGIQSCARVMMTLSMAALDYCAHLSEHSAKEAWPMPPSGEYKRFSLRYVVDEVLMAVCAVAVTSGARVHCSVAPSVPDAYYGNPDHVLELLLKMLDVALRRVSDTDGRVVLRIELDDRAGEQADTARGASGGGGGGGGSSVAVPTVVSGAAPRTEKARLWSAPSGSLPVLASSSSPLPVASSSPALPWRSNTFVSAAPAAAASPPHSSSSPASQSSAPSPLLAQRGSPPDGSTNRRQSAPVTPDHPVRDFLSQVASGMLLRQRRRDRARTDSVDAAAGAAAAAASGVAVDSSGPNTASVDGGSGSGTVPLPPPPPPPPLPPEGVDGAISGDGEGPERDDDIELSTLALRVTVLDNGKRLSKMVRSLGIQPLMSTSADEEQLILSSGADSELATARIVAEWLGGTLTLVDEDEVTGGETHVDSSAGGDPGLGVGNDAQAGRALGDDTATAVSAVSRAHASAATAAGAVTQHSPVASSAADAAGGSERTPTAAGPVPQDPRCTLRARIVLCLPPPEDTEDCSAAATASAASYRSDSVKPAVGVPDGSSPPAAGAPAPSPSSGTRSLADTPQAASTAPAWLHRQSTNASLSQMLVGVPVGVLCDCRDTEASLLDTLQTYRAQIKLRTLLDPAAALDVLQSQVQRALGQCAFSQPVVLLSVNMDLLLDLLPTLVNVVRSTDRLSIITFATPAFLASVHKTLEQSVPDAADRQRVASQLLIATWPLPNRTLLYLLTTAWRRLVDRRDSKSVHTALRNSASSSSLSASADSVSVASTPTNPVVPSVPSAWMASHRRSDSVPSDLTSASAAATAAASAAGMTAATAASVLMAESSGGVTADGAARAGRVDGVSRSRRSSPFRAGESALPPTTPGSGVTSPPLAYRGALAVSPPTPTLSPQPTAGRASPVSAIPIAPMARHARAVAQALPPEPLPALPTGLRALIVDDNKQNILVLERLLKKLGVVSEVAYDGQHALDVLGVPYGRAPSPISIVLPSGLVPGAAPAGTAVGSSPTPSPRSAVPSILPELTASVAALGLPPGVATGASAATAASVAAAAAAAAATTFGRRTSQPSTGAEGRTLSPPSVAAAGSGAAASRTVSPGAPGARLELRTALSPPSPPQVRARRRSSVMPRTPSPPQAPRFDIVLMDLHMPRMNGLEAARCIRAFENRVVCATPSNERRPLPIVAVTASTAAESEAACLEAGMNGYVTKPVTLDVLRRALLKALDLCSARSGK